MQCRCFEADNALAIGVFTSLPVSDRLQQVWFDDQDRPQWELTVGNDFGTIGNDSGSKIIACTGAGLLLTGQMDWSGAQASKSGCGRLFQQDFASYLVVDPGGHKTKTFYVHQLGESGYLVAGYSQSQQTQEMNFNNLCLARLSSEGDSSGQVDGMDWIMTIWNPLLEPPTVGLYWLA